MFISLEGIDGSGKTTQAKLLAEALGDEVAAGARAGRHRDRRADPRAAQGPGAASWTRSPSCCSSAPRGPSWSREVIGPAREEGRDVVCDRFSDSSVAYQGVARGLGAERVEEICDLATGGVWPDLTILLRIDPEVAAERIGPRAARPTASRTRGSSCSAGSPRAMTRSRGRHPERVRVVDAVGRPRRGPRRGARRGQRAVHGAADDGAAEQPRFPRPWPRRPGTSRGRALALGAGARARPATPTSSAARAGRARPRPRGPSPPSCWPRARPTPTTPGAAPCSIPRRIPTSSGCARRAPSTWSRTSASP